MNALRHSNGKQELGPTHEHGTKLAEHLFTSVPFSSGAKPLSRFSSMGWKSSTPRPKTVRHRCTLRESTPEGRTSQLSGRRSVEMGCRQNNRQRLWRSPRWRHRAGSRRAGSRRAGSRRAAAPGRGYRARADAVGERPHRQGLASPGLSDHVPLIPTGYTLRTNPARSMPIW